jgi:hypothetical protein
VCRATSCNVGDEYVFLGEDEKEPRDFLLKNEGDCFLLEKRANQVLPGGIELC